MKLASALALFLLSRIAFAGHDLNFMHHHLRSLQASQQCLDDTEALYEDNPNLQAAVDAILEDIDEDPLGAWDCSGFGTTAVSCTLDLDDFNSTQNFKSVCVDVGGQTYEFSDSVTCSGKIQGQSVTMTVKYEDIPDCIAEVCDSDDWDEFMDSLRDELAQDLEDELPGLTCGANMIGAALSLTLMTGAAFFASLFV